MKKLFSAPYRRAVLRRSALVALAVIAALHLAADFAYSREPVKKKEQASCPAALITAADKSGSQSGQGCGFFIDQDGSFITASRIIRGSWSALIRTADGKLYKVAGILAEDKELVLLKAAASPQAPAISLAATAQLPAGSTVTACGRTVAGGALEITAEVTGCRKTAGSFALQIEPALPPELDGCPVLNSRGEVVGAAATSMVQNQRVSFVLPCSELARQRGREPRPLTPSSTTTTATSVTTSVTTSTTTALPVSTTTALPPQQLVSAAGSLFEAGQYSQALELFQQAALQKLATADVYFKMGYCLGELGRHSEAIEAYQEALKLNSSMGKAWNNLGLSLAVTGKLNDAVKAYQQALEVNRQDFEAYTNLGTAYLQLGMHSEAQSALIEAVKIRPESAQAHYNLGIAYLKFGDKGAALGEYTVLKRLDEKRAERLFMLMYQAAP